MHQEVELPKFLLEQVRKGRVVLFLGAGVSVGSKNQLEESPPMGGRLAEILSDECSIPYDPAEDDLPTVAANAKRQLGDRAYWRLLQQNYQHCKASDSLRSLSQYPWHRVYSLNIDDALEDAYRSSDYKVEVFVGSSPVQSRPHDLHKIQLIHLNGSITRAESGIIFTAEEYMARRGNIGDWYEESGRDFLEYTFLFVGTRLNEPLFQHHVDRLIKAQSMQPGRSYIVCPTFSANKKMQLDACQNIECIALAADGLVAGLRKALGKKITISQLLSNRSPALKSLSRLLGPDKVAELEGDLQAFDVVDADEFGMHVPKADPGLRQFYYGTSPTWRDIIDSVPAELESYGELYSCIVSGRANKILLHGPAGAGKTTGLMWAALKFAKSNPNKLVLWFGGATAFPPDAVASISQVMGENLALFVDNFGMHALDIKGCMARSHQDTLFVLADRTNQIPRVGSGVEVNFDRRISMSTISDSDIDEVINRIERFGPWDRLGNMPHERRRNELRSVAKKQLLVGLREVTAGIGYDQIAASEYGSLKDDYAKKSYMLVAMATMHRLSMSRATFDLAISIAGEHQNSAKRLEGLEGVVFEEGGRLSVRHQILADFTVRRVIPKSSALTVVDSILYALSRFPTPLRHYAGKPEARLFAAITNHDFLWGMFRAERDAVLRMFGKWERSFSQDGLFWLQYSLFEQKCGEQYLQSAVNHIRTAQRIYPGSYQVINAYANIHFSLALSERDSARALVLMQQASELVEEQVKSPTSGAYAAVALYYGRVRVLKRHFPEGIKAELKVAEERLREAFAKDKDNSKIQDALNAINLEAVTVTDSANTSVRRSQAGKGWRGRR